MSDRPKEASVKISISLTPEENRQLDEIMKYRFSGRGQVRSTTIGMLIREAYEALMRQQKREEKERENGEP